MEYIKLGEKDLVLAKESKHKWVINTNPYQESVTRDGVYWPEVYAIDFHFDCEARLSVLTLDCYFKDCEDDPLYGRLSNGEPLVTVKKSEYRNKFWERDYEVWKGDELIDEVVWFEFVTETKKNPVPRIRLTLIADVEWNYEYKDYNDAKESD